jgi:hypothetical protein
VQYTSDKSGRYHATKTIRNVRENEIFPKLINRNDLIDFIDLASNCKSTQISEIIAGTRFTEDFAYRCRSELEKVKVLKTFHPELPVIDIDFDKVRIWKLYGYSDNWFIYYRSDDIRKRYAERGVNFDEIDLIDDEVDE